MGRFRCDYSYADNDTFYHMPASFGSIEEAFERIQENDIISKHCGGPEGGPKTTAAIRRARGETLKIYTKEMFGILKVEDEEHQAKLVEQLKRFLKLLGYCNVQEYLYRLDHSYGFMSWWFVYKHATFINKDLFTAMLLAYESQHMSEENRRKVLYMVESTIENYATSRYISNKVVFFNAKKLISLWRDAEVEPENKKKEDGPY